MIDISLIMNNLADNIKEEGFEHGFYLAEAVDNHCDKYSIYISDEYCSCRDEFYDKYVTNSDEFNFEFYDSDSITKTLLTAFYEFLKSNYNEKVIKKNIQDIVNRIERIYFNSAWLGYCNYFRIKFNNLEI